MKPLSYFKGLFYVFFWHNILLLFSASNINAQSINDLNHLDGHKVKTFYSNGAKEQAEIMAKRCDNVIAFYKKSIDFEPNVTLLVLSSKDWSKYTNLPVYGMPHYTESKTLIVASEDNDFWRSFIPPVDQLPKELAQTITKTYADKDNALTMRGFFDLLAVHELGHAYHEQGGLNMQRRWMEELFANILLHTYIAEKEPELLPTLSVFPEMVVSSTDKHILKFTTLNELESNYNLIVQEYPQNYGWYQCRWHKSAGEIYNAEGSKAIIKLWQVLKNQKEPMDDTKFNNLLSKKVYPSVANIVLKWNQ
ncbi:hypothetical protein [Flectobacillus roseus]|uniref:Uncharacterized protein n=1 Tax=Flectobacillus roseus TaxID=502259 RepID=A0ABT6YFA7_9BACT|nr:hypothetical protein [Flectobacillus roseus]MDI9862276.1 hypothetical protein [Flectobacillus roseus]